MSSTAHSRGQNTVVGQVLWGQTMDAFEDRHGHLKVNSMSNWKPMKVAQYWCYVVILPGESTYLCTATTKSLFPMAPGLQIPRSTETESLIDSSTSVSSRLRRTLRSLLWVRKSWWFGTFQLHRS